MKILLCALSEGFGVATTDALSSEYDVVLRVKSLAEALPIVKAESPSVIIVAAHTSDALLESCKQLRGSEPYRKAVIVATSERAEDIRALCAAGADDFFSASNMEEALRIRLLVANQTASGIALRRGADQDREQFFRLSLDMLCIAGFDGYFKMVNPEFCKVLGWSSTELMRKPWLDFVHPDDRESTIAAGNELVTGNKVAGFMNRYQCKNGGYRWLEWRVSPLRELGVSYAVVRDITDDKATRESLRDVTENLATTLNSIADGVIAADLNGRIVTFNSVAESLTGWSASEARGIPILDVLNLSNEDTGEKVENPIARALRERRVTSLAKRTMLKRRDGTAIPIADSCAPIMAEDGKVSGAVLVFRDLTAQRKAEDDQAKIQKQLVFADRMASVGTLAAGVAHEINNPLSYVASNVDMAIEEIRAIGGGSSSGRFKELEDMLFHAREGTSRVTKIVRGLKTFSRIEEERLGVINLVPVIELSINMAFNEIRHRARLVKDYGKLPLVWADDARMGQVIINLLVNAAQAFTEGNTDRNEIRVVTSTDSLGRAVIEVRDNGPGISEAIQKRIFDPFFTTKAVGIGTGLGLAISHNIVTGLGGEISVRSELGQGATFRLVLPQSNCTETAAPLPTPGAKSETDGPRAAVLVVDDDPTLGASIALALRKHDVTVVTSGQGALDTLATGKTFDVVLSDLMMPGMSGMDLYKELASLYPETAHRVVFITGGAFTPNANQFLDQVTNDRIEKPFDNIKLRALVQKFAK